MENLFMALYKLDFIMNQYGCKPELHNNFQWKLSYTEL
jgi:hypothetical protein